MKLTAHLRLVPRFGICGALSPLPYTTLFRGAYAQKKKKALHLKGKRIPRTAATYLCNALLCLNLEFMAVLGANYLHRNYYSVRLALCIKS